MSSSSIDSRELTLEEYSEALPSNGTEVFHSPAALSAIESHTDSELRVYGGFKGDQAVALLPVFVAEKAIGRIVTSPPPSMSIPRLGPLLLTNSPKQRKIESVNEGFTASVLDDLGVNERLTLFRMVCPRNYGDPRPFQWNRLDVSPEFTYVLDLSDHTDETVMEPFSRSLRNEMRRGEETDISVAIEGRGAAKRIWKSVQDHFTAQGIQSTLSWEFIAELLGALPENHRVYVAREPDGTFSSGIIVLYSNDTAYFWLGGIQETYDGISVNSLLHRTVIEDIVSEPSLESITRYDLVGANTERLCQYKGKFSGDLIPYYVVESGGPEMALAKGAYELTAR